MKKENLINFFHKVVETIMNLRDLLEDYYSYFSKREKQMTEKETEYFTTSVFYIFTMMIIAFILALPIMMFLQYPFKAIVIPLLSIGFAMPSAIVVLFRKFYWTISEKVETLFIRYSLPIIGLKKRGNLICRLQMKIFKPLRNTSALIITCYVLFKLTESGTIKFFSLFFYILLYFISWTGTAIMAVDGIAMYSLCLQEMIANQVAEERNANRLRKRSIQEVCVLWKNTITKKLIYNPKHLAVEETPGRENIFSLRLIAEELTAKHLGARVKSV